MNGYLLVGPMHRFHVVLFAVLALAAKPTSGDEPDSVELRHGELTCVLGNEKDHGAGRTGYIGLWSLTSTHNPRNAFVPRYAGWIQQRQRALVTRISNTKGVTQHYDADGDATVRQTFRLIAPYYFDCTFSRQATGPTVSFNGTSYMNGPEDPGIYFVDHEGNWQRHYDPQHGNAASIFPQGMQLPVLKKVPNARFRHGTNRFSDAVSRWRYDPDHALFYGRIGSMVLVHMFPPRCGVIPYMSPSGGGQQPDGRKNPAWDWHGSFPAAQDAAGAAHLTMRAIYKRFVVHPIRAYCVSWIPRILSLRNSGSRKP